MGLEVKGLEILVDGDEGCRGCWKREIWGWGAGGEAGGEAGTHRFLKGLEIAVCFGLGFLLAGPHGHDGGENV